MKTIEVSDRFYDFVQGQAEKDRLSIADELDRNINILNVNESISPAANQPEDDNFFSWLLGKKHQSVGEETDISSNVDKYIYG